MRSNRGIFWYSLGLTLLLLLPMVLTVAFFTDQYQKQQLLRQASAADSTLHIEPGAQGVYTLLLVVQQEEPAFVLARADGPQQTVTLCALPGSLRVSAPSGTTTLAECALSAGAGRAAQLLVGTVATGDTAYRSARLTIADWFHIDQKVWKNRLLLCVPVLGIGAFLGIGNALGKIDYTIIWRYFSWTNQTLAMIVLWCASMFLFYEKKNYWITAVPATFMTAVSITYFMLGNECLGQFLNPAGGFNTALAYPVGILFAALFLGIFLYSIKKRDVKPQYETLGK